MNRNMEQEVDGTPEDLLNMLVVHIAHLCFHRLFSKSDKAGVHPGQISLLHQMHGRNGISQKDLGAKMHIRPSTITVMIQRMEKAGLIERQQDDRDQRMFRIFMTPKGECAFEHSTVIMKDMESEFLRDFTAEEITELWRLLLKVKSNLIPADGETVPPCGKQCRHS